MGEEPPRVLVDTNVWISAFINPDGPPGKVLAAFLEGRFVPVISQALLEEIREVLRRPRLRRVCRVSEEDQTITLELLRDRAVEALLTGTIHMCRDPEDDFLLETALVGDARFAVSRDDDLKRDRDLTAHLERRGVQVLSVAQFLGFLSRL